MLREIDIKADRENPNPKLIMLFEYQNIDIH
jgi:hypothetical protein